MDEWTKILITAVVSSVSTAAVAEPLKTWLSRSIKRRQLRTTLYHELAFAYRDIVRAASLLVGGGSKIGNAYFQVVASVFEARKDEALNLPLSEAAALSNLYFQVKYLLNTEYAPQVIRIQGMKELIDQYVKSESLSREKFDAALRYVQSQPELPDIVSQC